MAIPSGLCANHVSYRIIPGAGEDYLLACGFMIKHPGYDSHRSTRNTYSAVLCLRGRGWFEDSLGRRTILGPGVLFQRFPGMEHTVWIEPDGPWAECWVHFGAGVERMLAHLGTVSRDHPVLHPGIDLLLVQELRREVKALDEAADRDLPEHLVRLLGLLLSLLGPAPRAADTLPDLDLDRACRLLAEGGRPDLKMVAKELAMDYEHFRKSFRAAAGLSPGAYRLRRRLERARAELMGSQRSVAAIANDLGWANPFTFATLFHRHVGMTPSAWRAGQQPGAVKDPSPESPR